jgi:diguanylate cyclase (GGDEF)-like protein
VLRRVAAQLRRTERVTDLAARLGGEEFALLLSDTDAEGAFLVAERVRTAIRSTFPEGRPPVTMSFGIASYPDHGDDAEALFRAADGALLAAKAAGRDRAIVYSREVKRAQAAPPAM